VLAIVGAVLLFGGDDGGGTSATTVTSTSAPPSTSPSPTGGSSAATNLPVSAALTNEQLVDARNVAKKVNVYLIDTKGDSAPQQLTSDDHSTGSMTLAPGRQTIGYVRFTDNRGTAWMMAADGTGQRPLFDHPIDGCDNLDHVSWDPADAGLLVVTCKDASRHPTTMLVVDLDGNVIRPLDTGSKFVSDPTISPDGAQVAYWADKSSTTGGSIFTIAIDGSTPPHRLTHAKPGSDSDPAWTPDGATIAFCRRSVVGGSSNLDIYSVDVDTEKIVPLVDGPTDEQKPGWSPNGDQLIFVSNRKVSDGTAGTLEDLWVVGVDDGSSPRPLGVRAKGISTPAWGLR
jgi:Tol biopolymer transport system component